PVRARFWVADARRSPASACPVWVFGRLLVLGAVGGHPDRRGRVEGAREQVRRALRRPAPPLGLLRGVPAACFAGGGCPRSCLFTRIAGPPGLCRCCRREARSVQWRYIVIVSRVIHLGVRRCGQRVHHREAATPGSSMPPTVLTPLPV